MVKLIEFENTKNEVLRGFLNISESKKGVLFLHGYERTTTEYKFKNIVDKLKGKVNLLRFDFSGCGVSDGEFGDITTKKYVGEIEKAIEIFKKSVDLEKITIVAHSFASCAVLEYLQKKSEIIDKIVFLGPAWNQQVLQRYWFAQSKNRLKKDEITIENYKDYISEEDFQRFISIDKRQSKAHYIHKEYFLENEKKDYQKLLLTCGVDFKNILIIHGESDRAVPVESNNNVPKEVQILKIEKGDHDLERMNMVKQYLHQTLDFILKE